MNRHVARDATGRSLGHGHRYGLGYENGHLNHKRRLPERSKIELGRVINWQSLGRGLQRPVSVIGQMGGHPLSVNRLPDCRNEPNLIESNRTEPDGTGLKSPFWPGQPACRLKTFWPREL